MINRITNSLESVTPDIARHWLRNNLLPRYRNIDPNHRDNLVHEILAGRFIQGSQIHFANLGNQRFLINGQHVLSAIEKSGTPILLSILVTEAESMEIVTRLYCRHDTHSNRHRLGKAT